MFQAVIILILSYLANNAMSIKFRPFVLKVKTYNRVQPQTDPLSMGCDYYIDKNLYISYHNDDFVSYINLLHDRGYYSNMLYSHDDVVPYEMQLEEMRRIELELRMSPVLVYDEKQFTSKEFEETYSNMIQYELRCWNKNWKDIHQVVMAEERYERII